MIGHHASVIQSSEAAKTTKHVVVLLPSLPAINPCDILQKWRARTGNWPTDKSTAKKQSVRTMEVKSESNVNGVMEHTVDHGRVDSATLRGSEMQPKGLSEDRLTEMNEESCCDEKDDDVPEGYH